MEQYAEINQLFWNGSLFQWVFYASVLRILIFEKRRTVKLVFGVFPVAILVGVFNPLTRDVVGFFFQRSSLYYVRLFSLVPVFYCMAYVGTRLLDHAAGAVKMIGVIAALVVLTLAGHSIYGEPWMQWAENLQKVPNAVFQVLDAIPRDKENPRVAFPNPLYQYIRQVDGEILMPYGRTLDGFPIPLLKELDKKVPDVATAMSLACNDSVDYIVVNRSQEAKEAFSSRGYEPVAETEGYYVYPVTGEVRYELALNDKRQVVSDTAIDASGQPTYSRKSVVSRMEYSYDRWGNCVYETYWDKDGQRASVVEGYSGRKRHYTLHGMAWLPDSIIYLDAKDQPLLAEGRYETRFRFIKRREVIDESFYDRDGQIMNRTDVGYARTRLHYNDQGLLVSESFSDTFGNPVDCVDGYASYEREYDDNRRITAEHYYDVQGTPTNNWAGFAHWTRTYEGGGNLADEAFIDADGNPVDVKGRVMRDTAFDLLRWVREEDVVDSVGVGYRWNEDGSCAVVGEAQGISWYNLIMDDRPFYLFNGETYRVEFSSENVQLRIGFYEDKTWKNVIDGLITTTDTRFTVPKNCGAVIVRLWVKPGARVNEVVHPRIYPVHDG